MLMIRAVTAGPTNLPTVCDAQELKLWEQGDAQLCWKEYKTKDINLANLNAPGAIPETFTFAGTKQSCYFTMLLAN